MFLLEALVGLGPCTVWTAYIACLAVTLFAGVALREQDLEVLAWWAAWCCVIAGGLLGLVGAWSLALSRWGLVSRLPPRLALAAVAVGVVIAAWLWFFLSLRLFWLTIAPVAVGLHLAWLELARPQSGRAAAAR